MNNEIEEHDSLDELESLPQDESPLIAPSWYNADWAQQEWPSEMAEAEVRADTEIANDLNQIDELTLEIEGEDYSDFSSEEEE